MTGRLSGRTALVTGAGNGIGAALARQLAAAGAAVALNDLESDGIADIAADIAGSGGKAIAIPGDVTDPAFPARAVTATLAAFGGIDIIVNNAGYARHGMIQNTTDDLWEAMLAVHLTAPFRLLRAAAPYIREAYTRESANGSVHHRKVVNVSSGAIRGVVGHSGYASAKAGLLGLTTTLAREWGRYAVNVNAVAFGLIETRMNSPLAPGESRDTEIGGAVVAMGMNRQRFAEVAANNALGRAGTAEEAAGSILLLCLPESDYISGQCLTVNGG